MEVDYFVIIITYEGVLMLKLQFVDDARQFYKMYSIWVFATLAALPTVWNQMVELKLISVDALPAEAQALFTTVASIGIIVRLVKQAVLEEKRKLEEQAKTEQ